MKGFIGKRKRENCSLYMHLNHPTAKLHYLNCHEDTNLSSMSSLDKSFRSCDSRRTWKKYIFFRTLLHTIQSEIVSHTSTQIARRNSRQKACLLALVQPRCRPVLLRFFSCLLKEMQI